MQTGTVLSLFISASRWPFPDRLLRADAGVVKVWPHTPTGLHPCICRTFLQEFPSSLMLLFLEKKKVWIYISVPWPCVIEHLKGKRERLADGVCALWMEPGYVICPVMMWPHANLWTHMDRKMFGPAWPSYPSASSFSSAASLVFIANTTPYDLLP